jgi:hypothetical protein
MFVYTTELAVHPPMNKGAIDRVGLADGLFGRAFLGEPQPGADRVVGLSRQPGFECRRIGKRQQWELMAHHFPNLKHQAIVGTFRRPGLPNRMVGLFDPEYREVEFYTKVAAVMSTHGFAPALKPTGTRPRKPGISCSKT